MAETLPLLYLDDQLAVVVKPAGLLVHRSDLARHETRFALQIVRDQLHQHVWAVHRLDRGTSGVLVFALDAGTARELGRQFEECTVGKRYLALVRGHPPTAGRIDHPLRRPRDDYEYRACAGDELPQRAVTSFRRLKTFELPVAVDRYPTSRYALLELSPETGRRHQIRRHLKHLAHPIIGDATYGKGRHNRFFAEQFHCNRLLLACTALCFHHPADGRLVTFSSPPGDQFAALLDALASYATQ